MLQANNSRKRKNYFDITTSQGKQDCKKMILNQTNNLSDVAQSIGLKLNEIILTPNDQDNKLNQVITKITVLNDDFTESKRIFQYLKAKDLAHLSEKHYLLQRKALLEIHPMPSIEKINKFQIELNKFFEIKKNENNLGYYCHPDKKIKYVCENFLLKNQKFSNETFRVKLNIDSTSITSSNLLLLNISFNLIDDVKHTMNINGTYILGSFEINKENYEQVRDSLNEILFHLENLNFIEIADVNYKIEFYLGCDYKMNRILFGQRSSNSLDGCFWCTANMNEVPIVEDIGGNKYTLSRRLSDPVDNLEPIIRFIEPYMCILDDLHLLLRVCDRLFDLLLLKCISLDGNSGVNLSLRKNLSVFIDFLEINCKIRNSHYLATKRPEYGKIQFRSFSGKELIRIFTELYEPKFHTRTKVKIQEALFMANLPFPKPEIETDSFKRLDLLWSGFYNLYKSFQNFPLKSTIEERKNLILPIEKSLRIFLADYLYLNKKYKNSEKITPYLHSLLFHYCQMLEYHGNIHIFSTQPNEKLNDFCTQYYHRNTNKKNSGKKYLLQLVQKRNRIEFYNLGGELEDFYLSEEEDN